MLLTIAAFLMWDVAQAYATDLPFYLAWCMLVNSGGLLAGGNPAGVAVSLAVIGAWCIIRDRFPVAGVICMACSLAIKPHDAGLIWLYLLLLGVSFRRRALQSFLVTALLGIAVIVWVGQVSPHWVQKIQSNLAALASGGSCNDPGGPAAISIVNLQTVLAFFRNDPGFYNGLSIAICAPLILVFLFVAMRLQRSQKGIWLGLATATVLSLLPLYHRPHDAKILLLTIPACAMLWAGGGLTGWMALLFTTGGILATSELPLIAIQVFPVSSRPGIKAARALSSHHPPCTPASLRRERFLPVRVCAALPQRPAEHCERCFHPCPAVPLKTHCRGGALEPISAVRIYKGVVFAGLRQRQILG